MRLLLRNIYFYFCIERKKKKTEGKKVEEKSCYSNIR